MEKKGSMIEVLGVPDVLPADRTAAKLHIYFLKVKHGGGRLLKVLYPCYQPGQAFVTFEEPEVAARVLRKSSHILEVNHQQYHLTVKAADHLETDFPVEATVRLNVFRNETQVREILTSQGFALTDLSYDQVRVKGSFLKLKAVKASLETLLDSQTKTDITPSSSSPVPKVSSGAISKYYTNRPDANRSRFGSRNKHASPSSPTFSSSWVSGSSNNHPTSPEHNTSFSTTPDQRGSFGAGKEFFIVDADVFDYAERLRRKDIDSILDSHNVRMMVRPVGDSYKVTLQGKSARVTVGKLQSLLDDLNKSLRTQEVPLKDMNPEGKALLDGIQKNRNIYNSVLVCPKNDKLHLIGPSGESYELKQRLLGRPVDRSGRTGRTLDKNPRRRSSSLPPISRKNTEGDSGVRAAGHSPSKYQDIKREGTEPKPGAAADLSGLLRRRSHSQSSHKTPAGRTTGNVQDMENKHQPTKSPKKGLAQLLKFNTEDIKQMVKNLRK